MSTEILETSVLYERGTQALSSAHALATDISTHHQIGAKAYLEVSE